MLSLFGWALLIKLAAYVGVVVLALAIHFFVVYSAAVRFFGGMSMREAADFLGISTTTGDRHWAYARAFLFTEMRDDSNRQP